MNSAERHTLRYQRRKQKRLNRKVRYDFDTVFSYENLYKSYKKCRKGVAWKSSTQRYITQAPLLVHRTFIALHNGTFKSNGFYEFDISERGKVRHIKSVSIGERVVQKCLCDYALVPVLSKKLIYDNGASLKNKGYHFTIRRLVCHLQKYCRKHGREGYILLYDFSKFFDSISHELCKKIIRDNFEDERIVRLAKHFIDAFDGDKGLGLGSQISQILALSSVNGLDHFIKEKLHIKCYGHYMDDGYLIHRSKEFLRHCLNEILKICKELGINLNVKKTQIVKLSHGFSFIKTRFFVSDSMKIIRKINRSSIARERHKLKAYASKLESKVMTRQEIGNAFQSWIAYANNFNSWHTKENMKSFYNSLFTQQTNGGSI